MQIMRLMGAAAVAALLAGTADAAPRRNDKVWAAVEANRQGAVDFLKEIVSIDSGTGDVAGGDRVVALLKPRLEALGAQVSTSPAEAPNLPPNLLATFKGSGKGRILIIAHYDTVYGPGTVAQRPFRIEGSRGIGPGVVDEKGGVVNAITALKILRDMGFKNFATITLLIESSEERGSPGTTNLIKTLAAQHDVEFNTEPGDQPDVLTVWRKGSVALRILVKGRAAHAGVSPQDGRNAALELIHQVGLLDGVFPRSGDGITVNLTLMSAGDRNNIIPEYAEANFNIRYRRPEELEQIMARARANAANTIIPDTVVTVVPPATAFPPLVENAQIDALADKAGAIYAEIGKTIGRGGNGGASESALAMSVGTPALDGLGYIGGDFHTEKEWIDLNSIAPRLYLFTRLLMEYGAMPPKK